MEAGASREQVDELWEEFLAEVKHLATRFVGKVMPKVPSRGFFTEELLAVKRALRGMRKVTNRVTGPRREAHLQRMQELYGEYKDLINARRRELIKEYYRKCSHLPVNDMFKLLKRAEKNMKLLKPVLETPGLGEIKDHYASQYASTDEPGVAAKKYRRAYCSDPVSVFTEEEVDRCIRKMPNNKAVGEDDLPIELVKLWLPQLRLGITGLFNLFLVSGLVPSRWKKGLIFPVYKEGKDSRLASSYRPICLLSHMRKVYERCLLIKTRSKIASSLKYCQFGFLKNRSTMDAGLLLDTILRKRRGKTHVAFLDVKGAYDTVRRDILG